MTHPGSGPVAPTPWLGRVAAAGEWLLTFGLAALLAWTSLGLGGYLAETMVVSSWGVWALAGLAAVLFALRPRPMRWAVLLPVPFLLLALGSVLWIAPAGWLAWREWLLWFQMWLVFALALHFCRSRAQTWTLLGTVLALALTGVAMAAYQRWVDPHWMMLGRTQADQFAGRSAGMFGIPNSLAGFFELLIPLSFAVVAARSTAPTLKVVSGWIGAVLVLGLVLTGSRGGWIATAGALAVWPLVAAQNWRRSLLGVLGVVAAIAAGIFALYLASPNARGRIDPFLTGEFEQSRPILWRAGWQIWQQAPWFGSGAASYNVVFDQHRPSHFRPEPDWTHNDYLNTLSDYGAVGFLLWAGAGGAILLLGWQAWRRARRESRNDRGFFQRWRWKFGLWLGLIAFALHLAVDFHTKIPALAYLGALCAGWLLRPEEPSPQRTPAVAWRVGLLLGAGAVLALGWFKADPLYRAEALRLDSRGKIDRLVRGEGTLDRVVPRALVKFQAAVALDPSNGHAWGDLAYATTLSWHVTQGNVLAIGRRAEVAARTALTQCAVLAEFWVHLGVALDMQARPGEAEAAFLRALVLAPHTAEWHYYYAHHLSARPGRRDEALRAVATCLTLDPGNAPAEDLRGRLTDNRTPK